MVTNRINHDRIEWHGSTPKGIEQPDFVWSEDNWFRPVDIELGPDGALYVADFYNRIIGHYEVPLTHPGRDRTSGRIWRIVYRGPEGKPPRLRAGGSTKSPVESARRPTSAIPTSPCGSRQRTSLSSAEAMTPPLADAHALGPAVDPIRRGARALGTATTGCAG